MRVFWPFVLPVVLSLAALLPWNALGPFDARDYAPVTGVHLDYPLSAALVEPLVAPGHILMGAPDFRLAAVVTAIWLAMLAAVWGWLRGGTLWRRVGRMASAALSVVWCLLAYLLFVSHVHFPGWQLVSDNPDWVVADLQSHTLGSHDGLVRADYNLAWHAARGYDVVAITEHDDPSGAFYTRELATREFPRHGVIPAIEVSSGYSGGFLLGLGLRDDLPLPSTRKSRPDEVHHFINAVQQEHGGAVISMAWRLNADDVYALAGLGVDAFEIANNGHPDIPADVREAMLELAADGKVVLVSSTDWHGWGGFNRTWSLFNVPGAAAMDAQQRSAAVVQILRAHDAASVTPLVAGYLGPPSMVRLLFTPLVETARYATELSWSRLAAWWLWAGVVALVIVGLRRYGLWPVRLLLLAGLAGIGLTLFVRGMQIYLTRAQGDIVKSVVTQELGAMAMYVGTPLVLVAVWWGWRVLRR